METRPKIAVNTQGRKILEALCDMALKIGGKNCLGLVNMTLTAVISTPPLPDEEPQKLEDKPAEKPADKPEAGEVLVAAGRQAERKSRKAKRALRRVDHVG